MPEPKGRVGPHEGREFQLFKLNKKDLIYFQFDYQPDNHNELAQSLGAQLLTFNDPDFNLPNYIYYRKGCRSKAIQLRDIVSSGFNVHQTDWEEIELKIGLLLGYTAEDVEAYIHKFSAYIESTSTRNSNIG